MNYIEQLQTDEWKIKREGILARDNYSCKICGRKRSSFLRLSNNFGIKSYDFLKSNNWAILHIDDIGREVLILDGKKGFVNSAIFVTESDDKITLENLKFALQNDEKIPKGKQLICFTENISEKDKFPDLNIHHKYYVAGSKAWEYKDEALITMCCDCHQKEHQNQTIPVYNHLWQVLYNAKICEKCNGSGFLPEFHYYENGICFRCGGHGALL